MLQQTNKSEKSIFRGLNIFNKAKDTSSLPPINNDLVKKQNDLLRKKNKQQLAAIIIQKNFRRYLVKRRIKKLRNKIWQRIFDPKSNTYFWYNKNTMKSQWKIPYHVELFRRRELIAVQDIIRVVRGFLGRKLAQKEINKLYSKYYDTNSDKCYYCNNITKKTFWKVSKWLASFTIPMSAEDQLLFNATQQIKKLQEELKEKEKEIIATRKKRYEELEPLIIADRVSNAKLLIRSKQMETWSTDELAAWFTEMKMEEYIPALYQNRVDGTLFINLTAEDWPDLGIKNNFHIRKLQLIMKSYKIRYERKKENNMMNQQVNEDDDLLSEYAPSELSEVLYNQDNNVGAIPSDLVVASQMNDDLESEESSDNETVDPLDKVVVLTLEQKQQRALDDQNIHIELVVPGDGENFPMMGDIVRVRYSCILASTGQVVQSTKHGIQRPSVEFVLGVNQVIKGIDRAIPQMSVGERAKIRITPVYGYGEDGLFPHIPPNAELIFDLTLLGFRTRLIWKKPLIQSLGLVQRPYEQSDNTIVNSSKQTRNVSVNENDSTMDIMTLNSRTITTANSNSRRSSGSTASSDSY